MAMVTIYHPDQDQNGEHTFAQVIESAFEHVWQHRGWLLAEAEKVEHDVEQVLTGSANPLAARTVRGDVTGSGDSNQNATSTP